MTVLARGVEVAGDPSITSTHDPFDVPDAKDAFDAHPDAILRAIQSRG